ncbi:MAG TPA: response regulator [Roseimicrobium sp.]|nr:response regulator [Roseimicrobium sp.]
MSPEPIQNNPEAQAKPSRTSSLVVRGKVLLIEDDPSVREVCYLVLRREGFEVLTADSESQANQVWQQYSKEICLVVTDVFIPERASGILLARRYRRDVPRLPVIVMSGFGVDVVADEAGSSMEAVYLQKPFFPNDLIEAISLLLPPPPPKAAQPPI